MTDQNANKAQKRSNLVNVGRISTVFGVKGWVKIHSETEPMENIFSYNPWWLKTRHGVKAVEVDEHRPHGKGMVAHIKGIDDRDQAQELCRVTIAVERDQMPELEVGEYYWHQLQGLSVITEYEGQESRLGTVTRLLETGANDVLVVQGDEQSVDQEERLIPYVPDQFVTSVDLDAGEIRVDWDPDF
ncbi:ribosome maturation factor RimM [Pseudomaricurvus alkylphenolicus]|jgi:16S rRNA processing protein RimM|uniref:ribosome maturation factor RimM n=1 Tax=Pseudomaricurvus alkylphenolicus TaxID=1306991 RepID=UPI0014205BCE|nr:ribosome maturation factor RimM [Pseudomaricurvus alkylphenolicus]NIB43005.1 ribosome maturation factor RimM [Pseudomaricurvus alkylphenolicus]